MDKKKDRPEDQASPASPPKVPAPQEQDAETTGDVLGDLERDRNDLMGRLQRLSADYLNYQKRVQRDIDQAREFANEGLIKELLPVLDDMERALEAARANHPDDDPLLVGMQLVHDKAVETLGRFGLKAIDAQGKAFDPDLHQAIMMQPTDEQDPQTVLAEALRGYQLRGRTIRPASVVVAVRPEPPADEDD